MDGRLEKELSIYSFILVIILSKSGEMSKSIYLYKQLKNEKCDCSDNVLQ